MDKKSAIEKINKNGILLVFPHNNQKDPKSLWSEYFPRKKMTWEWNEDSDDNVATLWHLMKELSDCKKVIYSKWYLGKATFFSRKLFAAILSEYLRLSADSERLLSTTSKKLLYALEHESPLSTKQLKLMTDLKGKFYEGEYNRGLKPLFSRMQIVAFGEVDDGAFPSLALGATKLLYEDIWMEAEQMGSLESHKIIDAYMPTGCKFRRFYEKIRIELASH